MKVFSLTCFISPFSSFFILLIYKKSLYTLAAEEKLVASQYTAWLYGSIAEEAYFYTDLFVGTPPQRTSVIIDTGSGIMGFPCSLCNHNCGKHLDRYFDATKSSTMSWRVCNDPGCVGVCDAETGYCGYSQSYSEGSRIKGVYFKDMVSVGSSNNPKVSFDHIGCHTLETNLFVTQNASGIMGLNNFVTPSKIISHLLEPVNVKQFSLCFAQEGGHFTFGQVPIQYIIDDLFHELVWLPKSKTVSNHVIVTSIVINGISHGDTNIFGPTLIDSGSTYSYLPTPIFNVVNQIFDSLCSQHQLCGKNDEGNYCFGGDTREQATGSLPTLIVNFTKNIQFKWRPQSYTHARKNRWCTGIQKESPGNTVFGLSFMTDILAIFREDQKLIGFVPAKCPTVERFLRDNPPVPFSGGDKVKMPDNIPEALQNPEVLLPSSVIAVWAVSLFLMGTVITSVALVLCDVFPGRKPVNVEEFEMADPANIMTTVDDNQQNAEGKFQADHQPGVGLMSSDSEEEGIIMY